MALCVLHFICFILFRVLNMLFSTCNEGFHGSVVATGYASLLMYIYILITHYALLDFLEESRTLVEPYRYGMHTSQQYWVFFKFPRVEGLSTIAGPGQPVVRLPTTISLQQ